VHPRRGVLALCLRPAMLTIRHNRVVRLGEGSLRRTVDGEVVPRLYLSLVLVEPAPGVDAPPMSEQCDEDDKRSDNLW
jgi:hypothetical protein